MGGWMDRRVSGTRQGDTDTDTNTHRLATCCASMATCCSSVRPLYGIERETVRWLLAPAFYLQTRCAAGAAEVRQELPTWPAA